MTLRGLIIVSKSVELDWSITRGLSMIESGCPEQRDSDNSDELNLT